MSPATPVAVLLWNAEKPTTVLAELPSIWMAVARLANTLLSSVGAALSVTRTPTVLKAKVSDTLAPAAVAACVNVTCVAESTDWIRVPAGMPAPVTTMPAQSRSVAVIVTTGELRTVVAEAVTVTPPWIVLLTIRP